MCGETQPRPPRDPPRHRDSGTRTTEPARGYRRYRACGQDPPASTDDENLGSALRSVRKPESDYEPTMSPFPRTASGITHNKHVLTLVEIVENPRGRRWAGRRGPARARASGACGTYGASCPRATCRRGPRTARRSGRAFTDRPRTLAARPRRTGATEKPLQAKPRSSPLAPV